MALDIAHRNSPASIGRLTHRADKGDGSADFVPALRTVCVTPYVARKLQHSVIDGRTTRHDGYTLSLKCRTHIAEALGRVKTFGGMEWTDYPGVERVSSRVMPTMTANNLARLLRLLCA